MRVLIFTLSFLLTACMTKQNEFARSLPTYNCPGFASQKWQHTQLPQTEQTALINKQKFAVPSSYQTIWFRSKSSNIGLCIVPDKSSKRGGVGCGTAYAIFTNTSSGWNLVDQNATICSR